MDQQSAAPGGIGFVLFALAVGSFAIGTTEFATMSLLPYFAADLRIDEPTAGNVISMYALGVVVGAPVLAVLTARMARRNVLLLLMALFAVGNGLSGFAPSYRWMLAFRFLSGFPHGAYFGAAAVMAASLVPFNQRTQAVGKMFLGLTIATVLGVPLANWLGQAVGWRWSFGVVAALAIATFVLIAWCAPHDRPDPKASPLHELSALMRGQVWLTLAIGAIGFGGLFAVYTYTATTLMEVTKVSAAFVPVVLAAFGLGLTIGNLVIPRFADRAVMPTAGGLLIWSAVALAAFPFAASNIWAVMIDAFLIGLGGALGVVLQTRLMDVSGEAQALPAALNHSAFNTANALGPWLGGLAISAGYGWTSTGWVGCALALAGFVIWLVAVAFEGKGDRRAARSAEA
ncbi:MFS transporter [Bradyrhizobium sp. U87765 SZCCT0131]|uniref:MFS transporter n=1 Tax=unclassified Bradyrhizobium TaxID=2631580 RepID=UPI001BA8EADD|nr:MULTISPECIES: MFS transporter [unclassified Bradyrhizobium]MBR1220924.1 MFS transporter [Bradyrhizobium sp. U87765 SZCCT0131]MBR1260256.1 MFS transporter [Bradyrhizobium sp. U87765 SZCCT0134]MBR1307495.1 MFS transporter [Bradyrhizobium sp. U87765 SZCCT0110]MBR1321449.1 MFS transporter [Bradyrhizobium sp. U87765 SZCCT0109]MBR1349762.1 MFS transporter [Bradyrhizobium sp. U87765 SZCCT0048]